MTRTTLGISIALLLVPLAPAAAADWTVNTPVGTACLLGWGGCTALVCFDGASSNPSPASGYVCEAYAVDGYTVCLDDHGFYQDSTSPTCA